MHELSIAQSILVIAGKALPENNTALVTGIGLQIGELSTIEIDSLVFAFSVIRADTKFNKAELEIEIIPGEGACSDCNTIFPLKAYGIPCPQCKSYSINILKGKEMKVLNITVDE
jgi:hydrogenase nickel incorporation protein HypA/HybF